MVSCPNMHGGNMPVCLARATPPHPTQHMRLGWRLHGSQATLNRIKCRADDAKPSAPGGEPSTPGDELLQERLVDVLRVQINQKEVEDFTEQKKQELTQVAEDVRCTEPVTSVARCTLHRSRSRWTTWHASGTRRLMKRLATPWTASTAKQTHWRKSCGASVHPSRCAVCWKAFDTIRTKHAGGRLGVSGVAAAHG